MKNHSITFALALSAVLTAAGQTEADVYKFSADIRIQLEKDTLAWKYQTAAVNYSFVGDYRRALEVWDEGMPYRVYTPTSNDSAILKNATPRNAVDYILQRCKDEQVVIINEAHHNSRHRIFTTRLLEGLYQNGYRYLGLEALQDSAINERNYAVNQSGYYTQESAFGNLVYEARRLGFIVFGYEASAGKNGKEREIEQAKNIASFMEQHADGKYLIHCGYDHAFEKEMRNWEKAMAGRLKEYTGIDPFTIDQVKFSEKSKTESGHYFIYATHEQEPFVLVSANGEVFNGISEPRQTDMVVIHPLTQYNHDRPAWSNTGKTAYWLPAKKQKSYTYPIQLLAYRKNEYSTNGIPADIVEIGSRKEIKPLYLQKGEYELVIRNRGYEVIDTFVISVEE